MFIERNFVWICRGMQAIFVDIFLLVSTIALYYYVMLLAASTISAYCYCATLKNMLVLARNSILVHVISIITLC